MTFLKISSPSMRINCTCLWISMATALDQHQYLPCQPLATSLDLKFNISFSSYSIVSPYCLLNPKLKLYSWQHTGMCINSLVSVTFFWIFKLRFLFMSDITYWPNINVHHFLSYLRVQKDCKCLFILSNCLFCSSSRFV